MIKYISVLLLVVSSLSPREALVEKSASLRFSGEMSVNDEGLTSYAQYDPWSWRPNATLQFFFQTSAQKEALVFYQDDGNNQFMDLFLLKGNGHARFRARVGQEIEAKQRVIEQNFADSKWHKVKIELTTKAIRFSIEDENGRLHTKELPIEMSKYIESHTSNGLFVAGIPLDPPKFSHSNLFYEVYWTGKLSPNLFGGCIGDIRIYRTSNSRLEKARLRKSVNAKDTCSGACVKHSCFNGGRCIDKIWKSDCDCSGTGHEGERCTEPSIAAELNVPNQVGGYISQLLSDDSAHLQTERNTMDFMFLTEAKDGVIFYMGREKDHLLVELVNGSLRVEADFGGGPVVVLGGNNALSDSCWHYVDIRRRKTRLTVVIDRDKPAKVTRNSAESHQMLNLNNQSNVIYYGGGPTEVLRFAQAKPRSFRGFLKQFHFEEFDVLKHALVSKTDGFSISDNNKVRQAELYNFLLISAEKKCSPVEGSGCSPSDDDSDSCKPSTTPTEGTAKSTAATTTTPNRITPQPQTQPPIVGQADQKPTPRPKGVSAWVIIVIVLAAMALVLISVFLLYRWNHRYTGSFKPNKNEEGQAQEAGVEAEQQQSSRVYNQPAFFVYKPPKKATTAQSPPVSI